MEILIGIIIGIILCRSNDKYKWFNNCCDKIMNKIKGN
jgi:c-di-AMP phosphodiesterase-like protein